MEVSESEPLRMARHRSGRRRFLAGVGATGVLTAWQARADDTIKLPISAPAERHLTTGFPEKGRMVLQRTRPPLLETPFDVFDRGVFTPNDEFYVRWHLENIPTAIDVRTYRVAVRGHVNKPLSLSLTDILAMPHTEIVAVNQCSGNSRGLFQPRVAGGEWGNGAMGNARWSGVRLRDVLDRAGVQPGAVQVRFNGLDGPAVTDAPAFMKSLGIDHARDPEVLIAFQMNGAQLPLLNGFPLRLVVPGWYGTYWVKMLSDIEVLDKPDENFWMKTAYLIPDTPNANVKPGQTGFKSIPINAMVPRSFFTNVTAGQKIAAGKKAPLRGIAFGGNCGVQQVDLSLDGGRTWKPTRLGKDEGKYSFRQWDTVVDTPASGALDAMVRCTNTRSETQPMEANWNPAGFMRNVVESVRLDVG